MTITTRTAPARLRPLDAATLAAIYDRDGAAVYGLAHWVTGNADVASQLTADVFGALRFVDPVDGPDGVRRCVLTDVHRRAVAWTREHSPLAARRADVPYEGFAHLDDDERTVIAEAYFGGKTYDAVAQMLGIECEDVARLMQQALRRLGTTSVSGAVLRARPQTA